MRIAKVVSCYKYRLHGIACLLLKASKEEGMGVAITYILVITYLYDVNKKKKTSAIKIVNSD